jgi:hypothetical protein
MTIAKVFEHRLLSRRGLVLGGLVIAAAVGFGLHAARASIPATNALSYTGTLMDGAGNPLTDPHAVEIGVFDVDTGGTPVCPIAQNPTLTPDVHGGFRMQLSDACATDIEQNPDLWLEVKVDGTPLARTKLGAVPYAVAAKTAVHADQAADSAQLDGKAPSAYTYTNGTGISLSANTFSADTNYLQRRSADMSTTCNGPNQSIKTIAADGTVTCEADNDTTYGAGLGLALNGTTFSLRGLGAYQADSAFVPQVTTPQFAFCALTHVYYFSGSDGTNRLCDITRNADGSWTLIAESAGFIECWMHCF